jgi:hypothetical protein
MTLITQCLHPLLCLGLHPGNDQPHGAEISGQLRQLPPCANTCACSWAATLAPSAAASARSADQPAPARAPDHVFRPRHPKPPPVTSCILFERGIRGQGHGATSPHGPADRPFCGDSQPCRLVHQRCQRLRHILTVTAHLNPQSPLSGRRQHHRGLKDITDTLGQARDV